MALFFKTLLFAAVVAVGVVSGRQMCSYSYSVPKNWGYSSCEATGGIDEEIEQSVSNLAGSMDGLNHIKDANLMILMGFKTTLEGTDQLQVSSEQQLENIGKDIENMKELVNIVRLVPEQNEQSSDMESRTAVTTFDPLKSVTDAILAAEMKVSNMSDFLTEYSRQQSIIKSSLERRLFTQQMQKQQLMARIANLSSQINSFTTIAPVQATAPSVPQNNSVLQKQYEALYRLSINVSASVQATGKIMAKRYQDLDQIISRVKPTMNKVQNELVGLYNDTVQLVLDITAVENTIDDVKVEMPQLQKQWGKIFLAALGNISSFNTKTGSIISEYGRLDTLFKSIQLGEQINNAGLSQLQSTVNTLSTKLTGTIQKLNRYEHDIITLEHSPFIALAEAKQAAVQELQKDAMLIKQLQMIVNGINSTVVAAGLKPTVAPGHHPRRQPFVFKSLICNDD